MILELRNSEEARQYLLQGFCRQSVLVPSAAEVAEVLDWAMEIAATGEPVPPLGMIADLGHLVFGTQQADAPRESPVLADWPSGQTRTYEDFVLGKLYSDSSFERGAAALCRYQGRDRARGLAYLIGTFQKRAGFGGANFSPAVIKTLQQKPEEFLTNAWLAAETPILPGLVDLYVELSHAARNLGSALGPEDVFELEHGTALMPFGERLALRQVLQATELLEGTLPRQPRRNVAPRREVATHILDEDTYPVGGFTSISTRGSIESLLHSQLAFMERDERPDMFDIKFLRDELLYYSRDENQFLRRRRSFVIVFEPDLVAARVKDGDLPWQRIVLTQALVYAAVRRLIEWLSDDALAFHLVFVDDQKDSLSEECKLFELLLREQIANGTVTTQWLKADAVAPLCTQLARRSLCNVLVLSTSNNDFSAEHAFVAHGLVSDQLELTFDEADWSGQEHETAIESWQAGTQALIEHWL